MTIIVIVVIIIANNRFNYVPGSVECFWYLDSFKSTTISWKWELLQLRKLRARDTESFAPDPTCSGVKAGFKPASSTLSSHQDRGLSYWVLNLQTITARRRGSVRFKE